MGLFGFGLPFWCRCFQMKKQNPMRNEMHDIPVSLNMSVSKLTSSTLLHGFNHVDYTKAPVPVHNFTSYLFARQNDGCQKESRNHGWKDADSNKDFGLTRGDSRNDDVLLVAIAIGECIYSTRPKVIRNYRLFFMETSLLVNHVRIECQICFNQLSIWKTWTRCNSETGFTKGADRANL